MPIVRGKTIEILFTQEEIARRNSELAREIASTEPDNPLVIAILKGSFVFAADLIRAMHGAGISPEVEFISISSYGAGTEAGKPKILRDVETDVKDRNLYIIDDILESGGTLAFTKNLMETRGAKSVLLIAMLDKPTKRKADINADFVGFECPDKFMVGYGMDVGHAFRELPYIGEVVGDA